MMSVVVLSCGLFGRLDTHTCRTACRSDHVLMSGFTFISETGRYPEKHHVLILQVRLANLHWHIIYQ